MQHVLLIIDHLMYCIISTFSNMWSKLAFMLLPYLYLASAALKPSQTNNQWFRDAITRLHQHIHRETNRQPAKNGIFFVGDGCGITTNTAARIMKGQRAGKPGEEGYLSYEMFPYSGLSKTYNVNGQVPDSAGTATALFTGVKTDIAVLGVSDEVEKNKCSSVTEATKVHSLLKFAKDAGMSTGIVTNMRITHATPAALYAHTPNRDWESDNDKLKRASDAGNCKDIAIQLVDFQSNYGVDVIFGGGRRNFLPNTTSDPEYPKKMGRRYDGRNLINEWISKRPDSQFIWNKIEFDNVDIEKTKHLLGLFEYSNMQYHTENAKDAAGEPTVSEMVDKAIRILKKNPKGFFLMVESGLIDYGHHDNNGYTALTETLELDRAVTTAMELIDKKDTLIVTTADHAHTVTIGGYPKRGNPILGISIGNDNKPELAANDKMPFTTLGYQNGPSAVLGPRKNLTGVNTKDKSFRQQSLYNGADDYESHGGMDVGIYSQGPWADLLTGVVEQNFIFHVFDHALCLTETKKCVKPAVRRSGNAGPSKASKNLINIETTLLVMSVGKLLLI